MAESARRRIEDVAGKAFFDFDVLVVAHSEAVTPEVTASRRCIVQAWHDRSGVVSTTVLRSFYEGLRHQADSAYSSDAARACLEDYLSWHVVVDDVMALMEAVRMEQDSHVSISTALVIQAAITGGTSLLYSYRIPASVSEANIRVVRPGEQ